MLKPRRTWVASGFDAARRAVVQAAVELAQDHQVEAFHHFALEAGRADQFRKQKRRTEVGEQLQILAQAQQSEAGLALRRTMLILRDSRSPVQDGVGSAAEFESGVGQRIAGGRITRAADGASVSSHGRASPSTAFSALTPCAVTSLPIPSPGRIAIFMAYGARKGAPTVRRAWARPDRSLVWPFCGR